MIEFISKNFAWLPRPITAFLEKQMKTIPAVQKMVEKENEKLKETLHHSLKPYHNTFQRYEALPNNGISQTAILADIEKMNELESPRWQDGYVSGGIYHGDTEHINFLNKVYGLHSQSNPLHSDLFPSATKFEAEVISMVATLHGQGKTLDNSELCGTITSGGSESIMLAMKTYRDKALQERGVTKPEMITPASAHVAFDKAAQYFNIKQIKIPLNENFTVNITDVENAITKNTVAIVGSAPCFPHGIIDPIPELSALALKHNIGFHTDACLGGFVVPFAEKLGYQVPVIDFRLTGVTSMSVDTHKYGYAAKGTSVLLYRDEALRHIQYYTATEWPGGLYFSPTLAGSRPGALSATCWAAMLSLGEDGYLKATKAILETGTKIKDGMAAIPELQIIGNPLWIIAFQSNSLNVYEVLDQMGKRKWNLNGLHKPAAVHIALTLRHTQAGVAEKFLNDLKESVAIVKANPGAKDGLAPVYGLGATLPFRGMVSDILKKTLDVVYQV